jgi:hypothetical protein
MYFGWQCPIQELPNRFADFVMMGLKREMSSIKEVDFSIGINKNDRDLMHWVCQQFDTRRQLDTLPR